MHTPSRGLFFILLASLVIAGCADIHQTLKSPEDFIKKAMGEHSRYPPRAVSSEFLQNGKEMKDLQRQLNVVGGRLGFNAGRPDGIYGEKTRIAIQAFQRHLGMPADGMATRHVLQRARAQATMLSSQPRKAENVNLAAFTKERSPTAKSIPSHAGGPGIGSCIDPRELGRGSGYANKMWGGVVKSLPVDIKPYLAGLCLPEDKNTLERLYLFLVSQGALHSRLTLVKYDELVALATQAGVDLGVRRDAFRRSVETRDPDVRGLSAGGTSAVGRLLEDYEQEAESAEILLGKLPAGYQQLEAQYKGEMRVLMSKALAHSVSSTFYLARSGYTAKRLTDFIDLDQLSSLRKKDEKTMFKEFLGMAKEKFGIASFIASKGDEMGSMLKASTTAIKTLTQDIEDVPRIDPAESEKELDQLRNNNNVTLDELERQFQREQSAQLKQV